MRIFKEKSTGTVADVSSPQYGDLDITREGFLKVYGVNSKPTLLAPFNNNLLDNSNFKNPVNQRGESSYTGYVYCIDRWLMSSVGMTYNVNTRTLTSTVYSNKNYQLINRVECKDKDLAIGDSVAISAKINGKIYTGTASLVEHNYATASDVPHAFENDAFGAMFITLKGNPSICGLAITPKKALTIDWVKVERGSIVTPYIPVSYAEELNKCLAFFQIISGIRIINRNVLVATGYTYATPISFPPKRITPTITLTTTVGAECNVGVTYAQKSGFSITYQPKDTTVSIVTSAYVSADL